jgi:type IV secretory pathway VirB10-like protein
VPTEQAAWAVPLPAWKGLQAATAPAAETNDQVEELARMLRALQDDLTKQRQALEALQKQKPPAGSGAPAPPKRHLDMARGTFPAPPQEATGTPRYTLLPYETKIPCQVETVVSSDTGATFTAKVTQTVYARDGQNAMVPVVPQNATIGGAYDGGNLLYGNQRLPTVALQLIVGGQPPIELGDAPVTDGVGTAGLVSRVDQHWFRNLGAWFISGALRGGGQLLATQGNAVAASTTQEVASGAQEQLRRYIDTRPTLWVEAGESCNVILTKALELPRAY